MVSYYWSLNLEDGGQLRNVNVGYRWFLDISMAVGSVATIVLIIAAIGLLCLKEWARIVTIGYGVYSVVMISFGGVINSALSHRLCR